MRCATPALNLLQCDAAHHEVDLDLSIIIETPIMLKEDVVEPRLNTVNYLMAGPLT